MSDFGESPSSKDSPERPIANPMGDTFNITVSVPHEITIRMVDASGLADYEIWVFLASILSSASLGFLISFIQAADTRQTAQTPYWWSFVVFTILFLVALGMAIAKRQALRKKGRDLRLRTTGVSEKE